MQMREESHGIRAEEPYENMFGTQLPLSGSSLCDAIVTLRSLARANVISKRIVAYQIDKMITAWERQ